MANKDEEYLRRGDNYEKSQGVDDDVIRNVFKSPLTRLLRGHLRVKLRHDAANPAAAPASPQSCFSLDCK